MKAKKAGQDFVVTGLLFCSFFSVQARAELCKTWSQAQPVGALDVTVLPEASGVVASKMISDRFYHHNDSGNAAQLVVTNGQGRTQNVVTIQGFASRDWEDIAYGACPDNSPCVYAGDLGDNKLTRATVSVALIRELSRFPNTVQPVSILTLRYPDGPHNAESLAIHPNGDLFILTKEKTGPSSIYRLSRHEIVVGSREPMTLSKVGELDLHLLSKMSDSRMKATAMDISADGRNFLVLTYDLVFEFAIDLSLSPLKPSSQMVEGVDFQLIRARTLQKQEGITYLPGDRSFLYTTESAGSSQPSPMMRVDCLAR